MSRQAQRQRVARALALGRVPVSEVFVIFGDVYHWPQTKTTWRRGSGTRNHIDHYLRVMDRMESYYQDRSYREFINDFLKQIVRKETK